jgi:hypothetical protein
MNASLGASRRWGVGLGRRAGVLLIVPAWAGGITVKEGQKAPEVELPATQVSTVFPDKKDARSLKLSDFKGKKNVVLWFYPKALTGG